MGLKSGPPNERPKPKSRRKNMPPIKSQAVMVITIDKEDELQVKSFGEGESKIIMDILVSGLRQEIQEDPEMAKKLKLVRKG